MLHSGIWGRVDLVWTDVSVERIASIFKVEKSSSEEPAWAGGCSLQPRRRKRRFTQDLHDATSQETAFFILTVVKTSNLKKGNCIYKGKEN
jgi:hypothetical protein